MAAVPPQHPPSVDRLTFVPWGLFAGVFVPNALLSFSGLSLQAKLAWAVLVLFAGPKDHCRPRLKRLAARLGVTQRQTRRVIAELRDAGFLQVTRSVGGVSTYAFLEHPVLTVAPARPRTSMSSPPRTSMSSPPDIHVLPPYKMNARAVGKTLKNREYAAAAAVNTLESKAGTSSAAGLAAAAAAAAPEQDSVTALQSALLPSIPALTHRAAAKLWHSCSERLADATVGEVTYFARVKWAELQARGATVRNPIALLIHTTWEFFDAPAVSVIVHRKRLAELRLQELRAAEDDAKQLRRELTDPNLQAGERALIETCLRAAEDLISQIQS